MKGNKSKKTLLIVLMAMCMMLIFKVDVFATTATATTTTENGGTIAWEFTVNEQTKQITKLKCSNVDAISGEITVPSKITYNSVEYTVASLAYDAFEDASQITKVTIPENIGILVDTGAWAGTTASSDGVFMNCTSLTEVILPKMSKINISMFDGCSSLKKITIPSDATEIGAEAFKGCTSLEEITIPKNVNTIGENAFEGCTKLKEVILPNSVNSIRAGAFEDCTNISKLVLSNSIQELPNAVFANCKSLTEVVIPDSVVSIQSDNWAVDGAFYNCEALQKVTIPDSVTFIGKYAFYNCGKGKLGLFVKQGSYAETWAKTNDVTYSNSDEKSESGNDKEEENKPSEDKKQEEQTPQEQTPTNTNKEEITKTDDGKDETITTEKKIPQTGEKYGIFVVAGVVILASAIGIVRYKKYKGI